MTFGNWITIQDLMDLGGCPTSERVFWAAFPDGKARLTLTNLRHFLATAERLELLTAMKMGFLEIILGYPCDSVYLFNTKVGEDTLLVALEDRLHALDRDKDRLPVDTRMACGYIL
jgi:hypothetical protein